MKIVVTGHTGFIGRHLVRHLKNDEIVGISRSASKSDVVKGIRLDISEMIESKLKPYRKLLEGTDVIIHLSAYRPIRSGRRDSFTENLRVNVGGSLNVLMMAKRFEIGKLIFASTIAVYGRSKGPVTEEDPALPDTNYGKSKLIAEQLCKAFGEVYGIRCTSLRISSVFGPGMSCNLIFADFLNRALNGKVLVVHKHLTGYEPLDLIYVKDVVRAIEKALYRKQEKVFEVFNIGGGTAIDTYELASKIIKAVGSRSRIKVVKTREDRRGIKLSIERASKVLGWVPMYDVESAIKDLLPGWYCEGIIRS